MFSFGITHNKINDWHIKIEYIYDDCKILVLCKYMYEEYKS